MASSAEFCAGYISRNHVQACGGVAVRGVFYGAGTGVSNV